MYKIEEKLLLENLNKKKDWLHIILCRSDFAHIRKVNYKGTTYLVNITKVDINLMRILANRLKVNTNNKDTSGEYQELTFKELAAKVGKSETWLRTYIDRTEFNYLNRIRRGSRVYFINVTGETIKRLKELAKRTYK